MCRPTSFPSFKSSPQPRFRSKARTGDFDVEDVGVELRGEGEVQEPLAEAVGRGPDPNRLGEVGGGASARGESSNCRRKGGWTTQEKPQPQ